MSTERDNAFDIPLHGDELYETPFDVVNNTSYGDIKKHNVVVDNTIAASVPASSYHVNNSEKSKKKDPPMTTKYGTVLTCLMSLITIALIIVASIALIAFVQLSKLRSDVDLQSTSPVMDTTSANNFTTTLAIQALESIIDARFSELNDHNAVISRLVLDAAANLTRLDNEVNNHLQNISDSLSILLSLVIPQTAADGLEASCAAIRQFSPSSHSGYYHIRSSSGSLVHVYCDMTRSCGNITGGWMRVAKLDMTDNTTLCPSGLELWTSPRRTCRIRSSGPLCSSDTFSVDGVGYSKVCGRIRAYQFGTPDAFGNSNPAVNSGRETSNPNIETFYVDGVSLTHGMSPSPRQHIWTFTGAVNEDSHLPDNRCSCINPAISNLVTPTPSFVGEDYFCDTAARTGAAHIFYGEDPLWDGAGCGPQSTCCSLNTPPWFYRQLPQTTTENIEMRVCRDEDRANEDIAIEVVEIYVQ